jgi:RHS repeat-associated protein
MLMPGRRGYMLNDANGGGWSNGSSIPQSLSINDRPNNTPAEYTASVQIDFTDGFESNAGDAFVAYITDGGSNGSGNGINSSSQLYRYGFNGQERSDELNDDSYTAEFWQYDTRIGRRWNPDPRPTVGISLYSTFGNNPIFYADALGDTTVPMMYAGHVLDIRDGSNVTFQTYNDNDKRHVGNKQVVVPQGILRSVTVGSTTYDARWNSSDGTFTGYRSDDGNNLFTEAALSGSIEIFDNSPTSIGQDLISGLHTVWKFASFDVSQPTAAQPSATTSLGKLVEMVSPYIPYERIVGGLYAKIFSPAMKSGLSSLEMRAAEGAVGETQEAIEQAAVHGNSLQSTRPTWGYKLYSQDGTFLKNGITSKLIPETRYPKWFMSDKYMVPFKQFPNRLEAYEWEFQQNQILRGPLNLNMH